MMRYDHAIIYMSDDDFEAMSNAICQKILGTGLISFTKGRDGGKDGRFTGKANSFPSESKPWDGKMIIQSKHTENPISKCTDGDFFTNKGSVINKEIKRLLKLKEDEGLDYYLLFTNRKYSGGADCKIKEKLSNEIGLPKTNVEIIGIETLNSLLNNPKGRSVIQQFQLNKYYFQFDFSDEEIKLITISFKEQLPTIEDTLRTKADEVKYDFDNVEKEIKNKKNELSKEYFEEVILKNSLQDFTKIEEFFEDPKNSELKDMYFDIASELNQIITIKRENFGGFEEIFVFIYDKICSRSTELIGKKRHVLTFLHYMYFHCDIGKK